MAPGINLKEQLANSKERLKKLEAENADLKLKLSKRAKNNQSAAQKEQDERLARSEKRANELEKKLADLKLKAPKRSSNNQNAAQKEEAERLAASEQRTTELDTQVTNLGFLLGRANAANKQFRQIILDERNRKQARISEAYDAEFFTKGFSNLNQGSGRGIRHFVRYFMMSNQGNGPQGQTDWKEYDDLPDVEEKRLFLEAEIADAIADAYFVPGVSKTFGFDLRVDEALGILETVLEQKEGDERVTKEDIRAWRVETMRLIRTLGPPYRPINRKLEGVILDKCVLLRRTKPELEKCEIEVRKLCDAAFELALAERACRADYPWGQRLPLTSFDKEDANWIYNCHMAPGDPTNRGRVLFGPLWMEWYGPEGDGRERIRDGDVLLNGELGPGDDEGPPG